jgi:3-oxoacyl-[acyl-carrier-protein] synthase III
VLSILGMGAFHPSTEIDNKFIEELNTGTTAEWIMDKIGIEKRVTTLPLDYIRDTRNQDVKKARAVASHTPSELGAIAAERALAVAGISAKDVGLLICNTCTPNETAPSEAQRVASMLGVSGPGFDVLTACPAFALHIDYLNNFKEERLPEYALCISTAAMTQKVNYNDRTDPAIWGDGAAAWVVSPRQKGKLKVLESVYAADPSRCEAVVVDTFGFFHQDGRAVRDFSVRQTVRLIKALEEKHEIKWDRDVFIGHQANATMLRQITENREIPPSNHWHNVTFVGNQAAAGAPAALAEHWNEIVPGQKVIVAVVGAGLSWGSVLLEAA